MNARDAFTAWLESRLTGPEAARIAVLGLDRWEPDSVRLLQSWLKESGLACSLYRRATHRGKDLIEKLEFVIKRLRVFHPQILKACVGDIEPRNGVFVWHVRRASYYRARDVELDLEALEVVRTIALYGRESATRGSTPKDEPLLIRSATDKRPWSMRMLRYALATGNSDENYNANPNGNGVGIALDTDSERA